MSRSYTVTLPIYYVTHIKKNKKVLLGLNWYRNAHYQQLNKVKLFFSDLVCEELQGLPQLKPPYKVSYEIHYTNSNSDYGNIRSVIEKFALDGFQKAGIIVNDKSKFLNQDTGKAIKVDKFPRAVVTVSEVPPSQLLLF